MHHFLDDRLKFRCSSRESKPATKLDWIINDTLNLSSFMPLNSNGLPIFEVTHKRFVRLPVQSGTPPLAINHYHPSPSQQQTKSHSRSLFLDSKVPPSSSSTTFGFYELDATSSHSSLVLPGDSSASAISLVGSSLDQILETSSSTLNFSVDANLIQLLTNNFGSAGDVSLQPHPTPATSLRKRIGQARGNGGVKWRKRSGAASLINGTSPTITTKLSLRIKCVARVLHLSMSDEITIRLVNKTRESFSNQLANLEAQRQQQRSGSDANSGKWGWIDDVIDLLFRPFC